ncbi:MAG: hypothetical protein KKF62_19160 [Bacteroidetes bacterium]|nr:hypothetical protein [Bacteroidota bacterium]MBU1117024.1 hypothetical protein [Bacteroidota bacterium]MBU1797619.1 hypothetical protein [Bacteroidota bacterium]
MAILSNRGENNSNRNNLSNNDYYSMFLDLHSSEIKYIVPWAQYDEKVEHVENMRNFDPPKLEVEEKVLNDILSQNKTFI